MYFLLIIVGSQNLKSINFFIKFLNFSLKKIAKVFVQKQTIHELNKIRISVLKSPHIHKTAQTQFYQKLYQQKILFLSFCLIQLVFFLTVKKVFAFSFYDVFLKFKCFILKFQTVNNIFQFLNLKNIILNFKNKCSNYSYNYKNNNFFFYFKTVKIYYYLKKINLIGVLFLNCIKL